MNYENTPINIDSIYNDELPYNEKIVLTQVIDSISNIDCLCCFRKNAKKVIILLPSAQPVSSEVKNPVFHRWSWMDNFKDSHVLCLSDPTLYYGNVHAGWFVGNGDVNVIDAMSDFIDKILKKLDLTGNNVLFYGSSMGGFGAMMLATKTRGSIAVAEVPQIDLKNYPFKNALSLIANKVLKKDDFFKAFQDQPECIDVLSKFELENYVPSLHLITNNLDPACSEHLDFITSITKNSKALFSDIGDISITILSDAIGHKPLPTNIAIPIINSVIGKGWAISSAFLKADTALPIDENDFKSVLDEAISKATLIKYIRDEDDTTTYKETKRLLYRAASLNSSADWPLLKICSITKLWTNSFNQEILDCAIDAFSRRQTLESFIYACRGYAYNLNTNPAGLKISEISASCSDKQVANIGNIFKAMMSYDEYNYAEYEQLIGKFLENKDEDFEPYISIPVSTVYTSDHGAPENYSPNDVSLCDHRLILNEIDTCDSKYIVSVSCDFNYLKLYGEYLIKSFISSCSKEAALHISLIDCTKSDVDFFMQNLKHDKIYYSIQKLTSDINKGPIASLLRFCHVYQLLSKHNLPVVVLDLDTVIIKPLNAIINENNSSDVCSRILTQGVAPWEKYTGGFAIFYPTTIGIKISKDIAYIASDVCRIDIKQWWIDQNCFEAGIRSSLKGNNNPIITNIISTRNDYCVMPVGNGDSKKHHLEKALSSLKGMSS